MEGLTAMQRQYDRDRLDEYARLLTVALRDDSAAALQYRALRAELAAAQHVSEHAVERELDLAYALSTRYPSTRDVLGAGQISVVHARVISDAGLVIGSAPEARGKHGLYEAAVLRYAVEETPGRLRPIAKRLAEEYAEVSLDERHAVARKQRRVEVVDGEDGMAELYALLPAEVAYAIKDRLNRISRITRTTEARNAAATAAATAMGEPGAVSPSEAEEPMVRSLDEIRADTLSDLLLNGNPYTDLDLGAGTKPVPAVFAHVQVVVPVTALTPTGPQPGTGTGCAPRPVCELDGYGPIATRVAAELLTASRNITRVDVDGAGNVLRINRYQPSKEMRRLLRARDRRCRFPGCTRLPMNCDIDHTIPWEHGGPTATTNLEHLCRNHHVLKHQTGWQPVLDATGAVTWCSPVGRIHVDRPPGRVYRPPAPGTDGPGAGGPEWRPPDVRGPDCPPTTAPDDMKTTSGAALGIAVTPVVSGREATVLSPPAAAARPTGQRSHRIGGPELNVSARFGPKPLTGERRPANSMPEPRTGTRVRFTGPDDEFRTDQHPPDQYPVGRDPADEIDYDEQPF